MQAIAGKHGIVVPGRTFVLCVCQTQPTYRNQERV
jgi:hypothetical protein